ncbi:MAG: hypothetical protein PHN32_02440 [Actinomycetota bacterium]|jgi:hypothetical protein|nr:hypothetical protein [Actinomycetota bacterium]
MNKRDAGFIIGGAIIGAILGFIIQKKGITKVIELLKGKKTISPKIVDYWKLLSQKLGWD